MTNGEKILTAFPNATTRIYKHKDFTCIVVEQDDEWIADFDVEWWNAEYKEPVIRDNGVKNELNRVKNELESTTKNNVAQERYQDLIEYFGDKEVAKTILEDRKEFKEWLDRLRWNVKKVDELARELERIKETTKNDLPHCQYSDEEIAKSFIEDVEAVKDQLPCGEQMDFPDTFDEFAKDYGFKDKDEVYTNGSELIPVFRVKQWLEHISTTKNNLAVDKIVDVLGSYTDLEIPYKREIAENILSKLSSVSIHNSSECTDKCIDKDKLISDCEKMSFDIDMFNKPLKVVALDAVKNIVKDMVRGEK